MADDPSASHYRPDCRDHLTPATGATELTGDMLATAHLAADLGGWPVTVYPSTWYGPRYAGVASLVTFAAAGEDPPGDAQTAVPLLTVLPRHYYQHHGRTGDYRFYDRLAHLLTASDVTKRH